MSTTHYLYGFEVDSSEPDRKVDRAFARHDPGLTEVAKTTFGNGTGGAITALLHGSGTTADPTTTATENSNFLGYFVESTATSGDARGLYARLYISGAGGSGEAVRAYTTVNNVAAATGGTVNGAHISLNVTGASGAISGSANALRATLDFASTAGIIGGACAVARFDSNIATGPTVPTGAAFIALNNLGTQDLDYAISIENPSSAMVADAGTGANSPGLAGGGVAAKALKIRVDGVDYWIGLFSSNGS